MKLRLPSPERCGVIAALLLAGLGVSIAVAAVRVVRNAQPARPPANDAGVTILGGSTHTPAGFGGVNFAAPAYEGPPVMLPCGHLRNGSINGDSLSWCDYGHRYSRDGKWWVPVR